MLIDNPSLANPGETGWFPQILQSRRKYTISRLAELRRQQHVNLRLLLRCLRQDARYVLTQSRSIAAELKHYGPVIRQQYDVSLWRQLLQQLYLVFVLRVALKHYRAYLLCDRDRWKLAGKFTYENYPVQMRLVDASFPEERELFDNKLSFFRHCVENGIVTPPVLAVFEHGRVQPSDSSDFSLPPEDIFIKELSGKRGEGTEKYRFREGRYTHARGDALRADDFIELMSRKSRGGPGLVMQKVIRNHEHWRPFTSGALSTCRVLTARSPCSNTTLPLAATMRMPVGDTDTDNTTSGGLASPVDLQTGRLGRAIGMFPYEGRFEFDVHPDTGHGIAGTSLPRWNELLDFAARAHQAFNTLFVGWDIALTENGFSVIEGNIGWSVRVVESPQRRPLLETDFPALFDAWAQRCSAFGY